MIEFKLKRLYLSETNLKKYANTRIILKGNLNGFYISQREFHKMAVVCKNSVADKVREIIKNNGRLFECDFEAQAGKHGQKKTFIIFRYNYDYEARKNIIKQLKEINIKGRKYRDYTRAFKSE